MNPTNEASLFKIVPVRHRPEGNIVQWISTEGRSYSVLWSHSLATPFKVLQSEIAYPQNSYTDTVYNAEDTGYYRVDVRLEP